MQPNGSGTVHVYRWDNDTHEVSAGPADPSGPETSGDDVPYLASFYRAQRRRGLATTTQRRRRSTLQRADTWLQTHDTNLLGATPEQLEQWLDSCRISATSRHHYRSDLAAFYSWATRQRIVAESPIDRIERPRIPRGLPRPISQTDLDLALSQADPRMKCWLLLAAYAGLRCCEIASLDVLDVDRHRSMILVRHGKGGKDRAVPLHPKIEQALVNLPLPRAGWIFPTRFATPYSPATVSGYAANYLRSLGIDATLHCLRHYFATEIHRQCRDLRVVQELLGHSSLNTTSVYTSWSMDTARTAIVTLGA